MKDVGKSLVELVASFTMEEIKDMEERDPQYIAVRRLSFLPKRKLLSLVLANAVVSYQLGCRGEEYWKQFADFFSASPNEGIRAFLPHSCNKRLLSGKLKRLEKLQSLSITPSCDLEALYASLKPLGGTKTISFAAKMIGYACRAYEGFKPFPFSIPLPMDSRMKKLKAVMGGEWSRLLSLSIPPLHLDSILWLNMNPLFPKTEKEKTLHSLMKELLEC